MSEAQQSVPSSSMSYKDMYASFMRRTDDAEQFNHAVETMFKDKEILKVDRVKTCLAIGTGAGLNEITVMKRFMPNLQSFTAVEPDPPSAAQLRLNLQRHLPAVVSIVHEKKLEDFIRSGDLGSQSYDAVLFFHVLYHIREGDRDQLYKTVFTSTLNSGGIVIINHAHRSGQADDLYQMVDALNPGYSQPSAEVLKNEFVQTGFRLYSEYSYSYSLDMRDPDEGLLEFFNRGLDSAEYVSMDQLQAAIGQVYGNHMLPIGVTNCVFYLFEKP